MPQSCWRQALLHKLREGCFSVIIDKRAILEIEKIQMLSFVIYLWVCIAAGAMARVFQEISALDLSRTLVRNLHSIQDLRKEATTGVSVYVQLLLGVACEACESRLYCQVLVFLGQCTVLLYRTLP